MADSIKIGLDTFATDHAQSGVGSYVFYFAANSTKKPPNATDDQGAGIKPCAVELFGTIADKGVYAIGREVAYNALNVAESKKSQELWHLVNSGRFFKKAGYSCVIYPAIDVMAPMSFSTPAVAVVNTVLNTNNERLASNRAFLRALNKCEHFITSTQFIKENLKTFGISDEKISVVYNGIDKNLFKIIPQNKNADEVVSLKPFAIQKPYFVYASKLSSPQKKHIELIEAFDLFKKRTGAPHRLVLAGSAGEATAAIQAAAFHAKSASQIFITGFFPHESFASLYAGSDACIFPSVQEGVGLPILEAMATGVPVACSNKGALSEIGGDAALYFDSDDTSQIAATMERLVSEKSLRATLIKKGLERASSFCWERTVAETLEVIKGVL